VTPHADAASGPIFVIGATRSGTSWLQSMLGAHPELATPQELDLFRRYLDPWREAWDEQLPADMDLWRRHRYKGLPSVIDSQAFAELLRDFATDLYGRVLEGKPGAHTIVDKDPANTTRVASILELFPHARVIHVIRDGRDVVASLLRASRGWGRSWAANTAESAAAIWVDAVQAGCAAAMLTPAYLEVRYEELLGDAGPDRLGECFAFAGVASTTTETRQIYDRFDFTASQRSDEVPRSSIVWGGEVRRRVGNPTEPEGFFGPAAAGSWANELDGYERIVVDLVAGALLEELGYVHDTSWIEAHAVQRLSSLGRLRLTRTASQMRFAVGAARQTFASRRAHVTRGRTAAP
jgi:hypothetical protein